MRKLRNAVVGAAVLALVLGACMPGAGSTITVGKTNFYEQDILSEIYAQVLEGAGFAVERKEASGSREVVFPALANGEIDILPEYAATALEFVNQGAGEATADAATTTQRLREELSTRGLTALEPAPATNQNAIVVARATAEEHGLSKISDLAAVDETFVFGGPPECPDRPFCLLGLQDTYGLEFAGFQPLDAGSSLTVAALESGEIDVGLMFTSDPTIAARDFVVLQDDLGLMRADNLVPIVDAQLVEGQPRVAQLLNAVSALLTQEELVELNRQSTEERRDPRDIAADWLAENNLP
jgi:osmoprotectant transport system substrate-binding protein